MRRVLAVVGLCWLGAHAARADALESPFASELRHHYYERLAKSPAEALAWELLAPGAGSVYSGLYLPAACSVALSLGGAAMWIAGAARDRSGVRWAGIGTFVAGRTFGLVSAPVGALLLNRAFRRQLGLSAAR